MATTKQHKELLRKYAEAVVKVGLNLRPGQRLIMTNATARGVPLQHARSYMRWQKRRTRRAHVTWTSSGAMKN